MLTIFSMPKAFRGHINIIQRNAICSWKMLHPECEVILLGADEGTAEISREMDVRHLPEIACNEYGTPLISDIFARAQQSASYNLLCYINADIILMGGFIQAVKRVQSYRDKFLMVGQRWDMDVTEPLDFQPGWESGLCAGMKENGSIHPKSGIDFFVFPRGLWGEMPPFAIGRTTYDNWLLFRAQQQGAWLIDATQTVTVIHQNHDYSNHPGGISGMVKGPEARQNFHMAGGWKHMFDLNDATHILTTDGIKTAPALRRHMSSLKRKYLETRRFFLNR
jgi:hypothetical protein